MLTIKKKYLAVVMLSAAGMVPSLYAAENIVEANDFTVTVDDFNYYVDKQIPEGQREQVLAQENKVREAVQNLYIIKALAAEGESSGKLDMKEVEWTVSYYRDRVLMEKFLELQVEEAVSKIDFDLVAKEYYQANTEEFMTPERVRAEHILISSAEREEEEALEIANSVYEKIETGVDFSALVEEYSDDPSAAKNKGDLGFFTRGRMVKPFEDTAFSLSNKGEVSKPVKTRFGYHIIKLVDKEEATQKPFDSVKDGIIKKLKAEKVQTVRQELIADVRTGKKDFGLQINEDLLLKLENQYRQE